MVMVLVFMPRASRSDGVGLQPPALRSPAHGLVAARKEVCYLRWEWEVSVAELGTSVFIIPEDHVKNGEERLLVLNRVARSEIEEVRGVHPEYVFTYRDHPITAMNNTGWQNTRKRVGLSQVRVHDLKHTFGRRLRAAGVSYEDRQDLLGHKS